MRSIVKLKLKISSLVVIICAFSIPSLALAQLNIGNILNEAQKTLQQNTTNVPNPLQAPTPTSPNPKPVQNAESMSTSAQGAEVKAAAAPKVVEQRKCKELSTQGKWTWDVKGIRLGISEDQLTCIFPSLLADTESNDKYRPWGLRSLNCSSNCGFAIGEKQFRELNAIFIKGELAVIKFLYMGEGDPYDLEFTHNAIKVYAEKFGAPKQKANDQALWRDNFQIFTIKEQFFILSTATASGTIEQARKDASLAEKIQKDKAQKENSKSQVNQF